MRRRLSLQIVRSSVPSLRRGHAQPTDTHLPIARFLALVNDVTLICSDLDAGMGFRKVNIHERALLSAVPPGVIDQAAEFLGAGLAARI